MKITHLDLFSGTGGFALGLKQAGFEVENHYFSEVDKHAIANYRYNFKNAQYVGSVTDVRGGELQHQPTIITFGSPCQDFSLAGKRAGLGGQRSSLVHHAIRLITECKPHVFIWENVKGAFSSNNGADFWAIIQAFTNIGGYRLEWQLLNTAWLLPQNRERIYLVGHLANRSGRNVFPFGEDDKLFDKQNRSEQGRPQTEHCCTIVRPGMGSKADDTFIKVKSATANGYETATEGDSVNLAQPNSETRRGRVGKGKAQTLETACMQGVIQINVSKESQGQQPFQQNRVYDAKGISPAIDGAAGKWGVKPVLTPDRKEKGQNGRRFKEDGEPAFTLNCQDQHGIAIGPRIRRLTEIECERLQGFPDNWTKYGVNDKGETIEISRTQRYKLCGNAVTVAIVQIIAERLMEGMELQKEGKPLENKP